jgi:hypothetical protein
VSPGVKLKLDAKHPGSGGPACNVCRRPVRGSTRIGMKRP